MIGRLQELPSATKQLGLAVSVGTLFALVVLAVVSLVSGSDPESSIAAGPEVEQPTSSTQDEADTSTTLEANSVLDKPTTAVPVDDAETRTEPEEHVVVPDATVAAPTDNTNLVFDSNAALETISGIDTPSVSQVWQLDYACESQASASGDTWFAKELPVHSEANFGFGNNWNFLKMIPDERNPSNGERRTFTDFSASNLVNSSGQQTNVSLSTQGTAGCYTRPAAGGATGAQSVTGDYFWVDHVTLGNVGPVTFNLDGLESGTYQMVFVAAYDGSHGREWVVSGHGFEETVPFAPRSTTLAGNYAVSPEFQVTDGISLNVRRGPDQNGLGERDGSIAGMILVQHS